MSSSSEPPSPTLGRTFLDRLTSVFHEEELNDRADVLEVLGEARRRNVIDDEVFSMMEGAMAVSEIRAGDLMVPRSQVQAVDFSEPREVWLPALIASGHSRLPRRGRSGQRARHPARQGPAAGAYESRG